VLLHINYYKLANRAKKATNKFMFLAKIGLFHTRFLRIGGDNHFIIDEICKISKMENQN